MWGKTAGLVAFATALAGCTAILGDFDVGDASGSDATTDVTGDVASETGPDATPDVVVDAPADAAAEADAAPTCGELGLQCCANNVCNKGECCSNKCVDTVNDVSNCGACNHTCGTGGQCQNKQCQPEKLGSIVDTRPGRVRVAGNTVFFVTVNGNHAGSAYSCDVTGCTAFTTLFGNIYFGYDMVVDATNIYVADSTAKIAVCAQSGCNKTPTFVSVGTISQFDGLSIRSDLFASGDVQPHQFTTSGQNDINLGNGNEGTNTIEAPPNTQYVYWNGFDRIRVGVQGTSNSASDFWTSTTDSTFLLASNGNHLVWNADNNGAATIYTCAIGSSCTNPVTLGTGLNLGYTEGTITISPKDVVYWVTTSNNNSSVEVWSCAAGGCSNNPTRIATVTTTQFKAVAGAIAADATSQFVYFTMEDSGTVSLYRLAL
jgi:hypothetical protein